MGGGIDKDTKLRQEGPWFSKSAGRACAPRGLSSLRAGWVVETGPPGPRKPRSAPLFSWGRGPCSLAEDKRPGGGGRGVSAPWFPRTACVARTAVWGAWLWGARVTPHVPPQRACSARGAAASSGQRRHHRSGAHEAVGLAGSWQAGVGWGPPGVSGRPLGLGRSPDSLREAPAPSSLSSPQWEDGGEGPTGQLGSGAEAHAGRGGLSRALWAPFGTAPGGQGVTIYIHGPEAHAP